MGWGRLFIPLTIEAINGKREKMLILAENDTVRMIPGNRAVWIPDKLYPK